MSHRDDLRNIEDVVDGAPENCTHLRMNPTHRERGHYCARCDGYFPDPEECSECAEAELLAKAKEWQARATAAEAQLEAVTKQRDELAKLLRLWERCGATGAFDVPAAISLNTRRTLQAIDAEPPFEFTGTCSKCGQLVADGRAVHRECEAIDAENKGGTT